MKITKATTRNLSTSRKLLVNKKDIIEESNRLKEENKILHEDMSITYKHMIGITNTEFGKEQTKEQTSSIEHIKETYSAFFENDSEEDISSKDQSPQSKEREQIGELRKYLKDEIEANIAQYIGIVRQNPELFTRDDNGNLALKAEHRLDSEQESSKKRSLDETSEQESSKKRILDDGQQESSKKRILDDQQQELSKRILDDQQQELSKRILDENKSTVDKQESSKSVHDYVENLPEDYNPFDDTGTD